MPEKTSKNTLLHDLSRLYSDMEKAYNRTADKIGLSCHGCPDNCCATYFQHHTYVEWAYLWEGIKSSPQKEQQVFMNRATDYVRQSHALLGRGLRPRIMCPLNHDGRCRLYDHRLMICRMHGVPNSFVRPDGKKMNFRGCFRCQEVCSHLKEIPVLDRTSFYQNLASLEMAFVGQENNALPRVKLTIAEMLIQGPPRILRNRQNPLTLSHQENNND